MESSNRLPEKNATTLDYPLYPNHCPFLGLISVEFSAAEIQGYSLDQFNSRDIKRALAAFNGFGAQFGRDWPLKRIRVLTNPSFVREVTSYWEDWQLLKCLPQSDIILRRWAPSIDADNVSAEVCILAGLRRRGADIELFPSFDGRVPDARWCSSDGSAVLLEVSSRHAFRHFEATSLLLAELAATLRTTVRSPVSKLAVLRPPSDIEKAHFVSWLREDCVGGDGELKCGDWAVLKTERADAYNDTQIVDAPGLPRRQFAIIHPEELEWFDRYIPEPRLFTTAFHNAPLSRAHAGIAFSDENADRVLRREAKQLSRDAPGAVLIELTGVGGGAAYWRPLIERRLQPNLHTRIGAVVLFERSIHEKPWPAFKGVVIVNRHARHPLPERVTNILHALVGSYLGDGP